MKFYSKTECGANSYFDESSLEMSILESEGGGMRAMWRGVITQALMDAASNSKKRTEIAHKKEALDWLKGDSEDFLQVCFLADMSPEYVKKQAASAISRGCKWRNDSRAAIAIKASLEEEINKMEDEAGNDIINSYRPTFGVYRVEAAPIQYSNFALDN